MGIGESGDTIPVMDAWAACGDGRVSGDGECRRPCPPNAPETQGVPAAGPCGRAGATFGVALRATHHFVNTSIVSPDSRNPYVSPSAVGDVVDKSTRQSKQAKRRMTAEEVAVVGLIGLVLSFLLLPSIGATFAPPAWCYGLAVLVSLLTFLLGAVSAIVGRLRERTARVEIATVAAESADSGPQRAAERDQPR